MIGKLKKGIECWSDYDSTGKWCLRIKKARGELTLEEIRQAAMHWEEDFYALIIKAVDEDMDQYFDDIDVGDFITLYRATDFLREKNT